LKELIDKKVILFCCRYIYCGKLISINDDSITLEDGSIVYDTGALDTGNWDYSEKLPTKVWYVARQSIESFGEMV